MGRDERDIILAMVEQDAFRDDPKFNDILDLSRDDLNKRVAKTGLDPTLVVMNLRYWAELYWGLATDYKSYSEKYFKLHGRNQDFREFAEGVFMMDAGIRMKHSGSIVSDDKTLMAQYVKDAFVQLAGELEVP